MSTFTDFDRDFLVKEKEKCCECGCKGGLTQSIYHSKGMKICYECKISFQDSEEPICGENKLSDFIQADVGYGDMEIASAEYYAELNKNP